MRALGVVLNLRKENISIEDLNIERQKLYFHPRSGHPIARLLPTIRNEVVGSCAEESFALTAELDEGEMEALYASDWSDNDMANTNWVGMKKGVARRFRGIAGYASTVARAPRRRGFKVLEVFTWNMIISLVAPKRGWHVFEPVLFGRWLGPQQLSSRQRRRVEYRAGLDSGQTGGWGEVINLG